MEVYTVDAPDAVMMIADRVRFDPLHETMRILIWAKTYPELSKRHKETVCTAGCTEQGEPIRLYPIPLRYMPDHQKYKLYDWVDVKVEKNRSDSRPESYKVVGDFERVDRVGTDHGAWSNRRRVLFQNEHWQYDCLSDLRAERQDSGRSLGFVKVGRIDRVWTKVRSKEDAANHAEKLDRIRRQGTLFDDQRALNLEFQPSRVHVGWRCARLDGPNACPGHTAGVFDWGLGELGRRNGADAALDHMKSLADLGEHDLGFFLGNFKAHPQNFGIIGLWYPKRVQADADIAQSDMFGAM